MLFTYKIYDDFGRNLIFVSYSQAAFKAEVRRLEFEGKPVNQHNGAIRTNTKRYKIMTNPELAQLMVVIIMVVYCIQWWLE